MIPEDWTPDQFEDLSHQLMCAVEMQITGELERHGFDPCPAIKIAQMATKDAWEIWNKFIEERMRLKTLFSEHTSAVGAFLSELHAIMVDPLADGEIKVQEMMNALRETALQQREQWAGLIADQQRIDGLEKVLQEGREIHLRFEATKTGEEVSLREVLDGIGERDAEATD